LDQWRASGVEVMVRAVDVADFSALKTLFADIHTIDETFARCDSRCWCII
jgi:hypothetical protein